jgi:hypothetical protein
MRKLNSLIIIVCVLGVALIPGVGIAELSLLTDDELRDVTGQGGISLVAEDQIAFDMSIGTGSTERTCSSELFFDVRNPMEVGKVYLATLPSGQTSEALA